MRRGAAKSVAGMCLNPAPATYLRIPRPRVCPTWDRQLLWSEQCRGYDRDPVWSSVGRRSSCDDDGVCEVVAELIAEPAKMAQVLLVGCLPELHLDCEDLGSALDDEVDLAVAAPGS
jgi:hypothetical protein